MFTQHMIRFAIVLSFSAFANAWATPYEPVVHITELTDESRARTMEVWIWGPGDHAGGASEVAGNSVFEPVTGRTGRVFAPGLHPLIVFFHGTSGNTRSIAWLSSALAAHGYIVVSANHPGSTSMEVTQDSMMKTWLQAEDGRQECECAACHGPLLGLWGCFGLRESEPIRILDDPRALGPGCRGYVGLVRGPYRSRCS